MPTITPEDVDIAVADILLFIERGGIETRANELKLAIIKAERKHACAKLSAQKAKHLRTIKNHKNKIKTR